MARTSSRQRAYDAVKLFEGMGKTVKSISFLKAGEFKLEFVTDESEEPHPLDNIDWSAGRDFKLGKRPKRNLDAMQAWDAANKKNKKT